MVTLIFVIEGTIGVGKTTILEQLRKKGARVYPEPTEEWDILLKEFYKDPCLDVAIRLQVI